MTMTRLRWISSIDAEIEKIVSELAGTDDLPGWIILEAVRRLV